MHTVYIFYHLVAVPKPSVDQSTDQPNAGSAHNLTCTFTLPDGVSPDLLRIEWSEHPSLNNSRGMISNLTHVMGLQYTKSVTFEHIGTEDNGQYTCTVNIVGFASNFNVTIVNGKYILYLYVYIYYMLCSCTSKCILYM